MELVLGPPTHPKVGYYKGHAQFNKPSTSATEKNNLCGWSAWFVWAPHKTGYQCYTNSSTVARCYRHWHPHQCVHHPHIILIHPHWNPLFQKSLYCNVIDGKNLPHGISSSLWWTSSLPHFEEVASYADWWQGSRLCWKLFLSTHWRVGSLSNAKPVCTRASKFPLSTGRKKRHFVTCLLVQCHENNPPPFFEWWLYQMELQ